MELLVISIVWTLDPVDWKKPGVEKMKSEVMANIGGGMIILMHPILIKGGSWGYRVYFKIWSSPE